jgi:uncharacterized protein (DUF1800 family)
MNNPRLHIFNRLAYGPGPRDLEAAAPDLEEFLEAQLRPDRIADREVDAALEPLGTLRMAGEDLVGGMAGAASQRQALAELTEAKLVRALGSRRQFQEVMVDFWFNHFNVFSGKGLCRVLVSSYERDAIRPHVFGRFRDLLAATARHPAMLFYLDNWLSAAPRQQTRAAGRRRGLNENYARELMELHTLGVEGGYTQQDVVEVARAFTGWTIEGRQRPVFRFAPALHDSGRKEVMGRRVSGSGIEEGLAVIDQLARHPSTARFVSGKLAVRFVSDDPPPALVERAAETFMTSDGDIAEVLRTLVLSPEFGESEAQKVKTPLEFVVSAFRRLDLEVESANLLGRALNQMGQAPYGAAAPTGYPDHAADWMGSGALMARLNLVTRLASGRVPGVTFPPGDRQGWIRTLAAADFQRK